MKATCTKEIGGQYITPGTEYTYRQDGNTVYYKRADGAGSWMPALIWDRAVKAGAIVLNAA